MLNWVKCNSWGDLPLGQVIVAIEEQGVIEHHMADVSRNAQNLPLVVVSNSFHFDYNPPLAYASFNKYTKE